ncbi:MAG: hemerythrin family protein [Rhodocyclaceae bacterium]|nr:hemerythrin family protein [Rhodocyclaceae bacterium]
MAREANKAIDDVAELIRHEHRLLAEKLGQLRDVCACAAQKRDCAACDRAQVARCELEVAKVLEEVFVYMVEHFRTEESVIRDHRLDILDRACCEGHREAHAEITEQARKLIAGLTPTTVIPRLNELVGLMQGWLGGHIASHDHRLLGLLGAEREQIARLVSPP